MLGLFEEMVTMPSLAMNILLVRVAVSLDHQASSHSSSPSSASPSSVAVAEIETRGVGLDLFGGGIAGSPLRM
jgi:hypothetical protein